MEAHSQVAIIPYVITTDGPEILLITSRGAGRWVIPKGWLKDELGPKATAEREALEEAGIKGEISPKPIGGYNYKKRLHVFSSVQCHVSVFAMQVTLQKLNWREKSQRELQWVSPNVAAQLVREAELSALFDRIPPLPAAAGL